MQPMTWQEFTGLRETAIEDARILGLANDAITRINELLRQDPLLDLPFESHDLKEARVARETAGYYAGANWKADYHKGSEGTWHVTLNAPEYGFGAPHRPTDTTGSIPVVNAATARALEVGSEAKEDDETMPLPARERRNRKRRVAAAIAPLLAMSLMLSGCGLFDRPPPPDCTEVQQRTGITHVTEYDEDGWECEPIDAEGNELDEDADDGGNTVKIKPKKRKRY